MDQVSPVHNLLIENVESCSWNSSSPRQSPVTIAPYSGDDSHHLVVKVENAPSESGGSLCDVLTPGRSVEAEHTKDVSIHDFEHHSPVVEIRQAASIGPQLLINEAEQESEHARSNPAVSMPCVEPGKKDPRIHVSLEGGELWRQFLQVGTEMIITRSGRYVR